MTEPTFTSEEQAFATEVFAIADPDATGIIPRDIAVQLFAGSDIPADTLGDIWELANQENARSLTRKGLAVALRLLSHAQFGESVSERLINKPAPPPTLKGVAPVPVSPPRSRPTLVLRPEPRSTPRPVPPIPTSAPPSYAQSSTPNLLTPDVRATLRPEPSTPRPASAPALPRSPPPSTETSTEPLIKPEDRAKFTRIFEQSKPLNGLLSSEKGREVFLRSRLPVEILAQIWELADTQRRGSLDLTDFIVGMYFIKSIMDKSLPVLPSSLPPGLYDQASGGRSRMSFPGYLSPMSGQYAVQQPMHSPMTSGSPYSSVTPSPQVNGASTSMPSTFPFASQGQIHHFWEISPMEKATSDRSFSVLDTTGRGYLSRDICMPLMKESGLPEAALGHIWDLADMDRSGHLDKDTFAVATHLIKGQMSGRSIPQFLPLSLVPPSRRQQLDTMHVETTQGTQAGVQSGPISRVVGVQGSVASSHGAPVVVETTSSVASRPSKDADSAQVAGECVVCQDEEANVVIVECGHLALCTDCSHTIWKTTRECPLCRKSIGSEHSLIRVYRS